MARFCVYPAIADQDEANDLLARLAWFFADAPVNSVILYSDLGKYLIDNFQCPPELDAGISERYSRLKPRLEVKAPADASQDISCDAIFLWQDLEEHHQHLRKTHGNVRIWKVDKNRTRMEGSFWIEAHFALQQDIPAIIVSTRRKLAQCHEDFKDLHHATLLASGPSVAAYKDFDYRDSLTIVCNTVVADTELLEHVRPKVLCFADPLFHFGPSRYAMEFRRRMTEAVHRYNPWIIVPLKYYQLLCKQVPEISERLIALPHAHRKQFNTNLLSDPELKTTANILTYLMLPFAATFTREVRLLGCDGRPLAENQYFWSFNPRTQLSPELMQNIQDTHPAFFAIDYNSYYSEHTQTVESLVQAIEQKGGRVRSLTSSHIPVLQRRSPPPSLEALNSLLSAAQGPLFISLNPNLSGIFGHYLHFDARLDQSLKARGSHLLTLASRDLNLSQDDAAWPVLPYFSMHAHHANRSKYANKDYQEWALGFREELRALVDLIAKHPDKDITLFHYMVTPRMLHELVVILAEKPAVHARWIMNLTGIYVQGWPVESLNKDVRFQLARFCVQQSPALMRNFRLSVITDTAQLAQHMADGSPPPPVLPMFGVTPPSTCPIAPPAGRLLSVIYPTNAQSLKGFDLLAPAIDLLLRDEPERYRFIVRTHVPIGRERDEMEQARQSFHPSVEQHEGVLEQTAYHELLAKADIILLPYRAKAFYLRTSGQLIDAIISGKPVVATRETWAGQIVEAYGCGAVFTDGSPKDLALAIKYVADNLDTCRDGLRRAREEWLPHNTPEACVDFLLQTSRLADAAESEDSRQHIAHSFNERFGEPKTKSERPKSTFRKLLAMLRKR